MPEGMTSDREIASVRAAMDRLWWDVRDLFVACLQYGDVGTEADLRAHLATGDRLTDAQHAVIVATLNDGLLAQGDAFRI
jgi:hypothetical protein